MFQKRDKLDMLSTSVEEILKEMFPEGDPGSPIPCKYQNIGHYTLNEKGVHCFEIDEKGDIDVATIYPIPFIVRMAEEGHITFEFFLPEHTEVEIASTLDKYIEDTFHSLPAPARYKIKRYCSYCIMKTWEQEC